MTAQLPTDFPCTRCGECCRIPGQVHLTPADIARLAALLGLRDYDFIQRHTHLARDRRDLVLQGDPAKPCRFLNGNDCAVYPARPEQCAGYPEMWKNPGWEKICKHTPAEGPPHPPPEHGGGHSNMAGPVAAAPAIDRTLF